MTGEEPPRDDFEARLQRAQAARQAKSGASDPAKTSPAMGMGFRIGVDLVAALGVGVGIGYVLDRWLGTAPWLLIGFFFLGSAAGVLNVFRAVRGYGYAAGYRDARPRDAARDDAGNGDRH
jgi:ATP synthase protein I